MQLAQERCTEPPAGTPPLSGEQAAEMGRQVPEWSLGDGQIERQLRFQDFRGAIDFVNRVAQVAEEQNHHPDLHVLYNKVRVVLSTHKVGGLSRNDFILAARIDRLIG